MSSQATTTDRLDSWKDIAAYLKRNQRTAIRWEREKGLPVHRVPGGQRQGVFAYRHELDAWLAGSNSANVEEKALSNGGDLVAVSTVLAVPLPQEYPSAGPHVETSSRKRPLLYVTAGILVALLLMGAAYRYVYARLSLRAPQLLGSQQLTANGHEKRGLLTDGKALYFGQEQDGWYALTEMARDGGPTRVIWNPHANVLPVDISPNHRKLLALTAVGVERDRELWVVPLDGGQPHRLSDVTAHAATWAPDGKTIAYAEGTGIYLISEDGRSRSQIGSFTAFPCALLWSQDGQRLSFVLQDVSTDRAKHWGQFSGAGMKTITLRALPNAMEEYVSIDGYGCGTCEAAKDVYFLTGTGPSPESSPVWLAQYGSKWWEPPIQIAPMPLLPGHVSGISFIKESSRLFVMSEIKSRTSFMRFDPRSQEFRRILPSVSGAFLDYSRDGEWITYTSYHEDSLWISRADGSAARQITFPPETVELPRWSPDGKQIAFMSQRPNRPWRIYVLQVDTGVIREASKSNDSQGAPTWSLDGRFLVYGNVKCEQTHDCAIHRIDVATGKVQILPDSEGLFTARWSPDGRSIAALYLDQHQLFLFDVKSEKWHKLADSINGSDLSWSADSHYLYANVPGSNARIIRIRAADGQQRTVLDLRTQEQFDWTDSDDLQFSVGPDDAVILHSGLHSQEIYAYNLQFQ